MQVPRPHWLCQRSFLVSAALHTRQPFPWPSQVEQGEDGFATASYLGSLQGHDKTVNCVRVSPTGRLQQPGTERCAGQHDAAGLATVTATKAHATCCG